MPGPAGHLPCFAPTVRPGRAGAHGRGDGRKILPGPLPAVGTSPRQAGSPAGQGTFAIAPARPRTRRGCHLSDAAARHGRWRRMSPFWVFPECATLQYYPCGPGSAPSGFRHGARSSRNRKNHGPAAAPRPFAQYRGCLVGPAGTQMSCRTTGKEYGLCKRGAS